MPTADQSYTLLQISGSDAAEFLRAQLTVDAQRLGADHHALAAWCDAKGRALCTTRIIPADPGFLLLLPTGVANAISRRLRMYVLRAQVEINDVTGQWTVNGQTTGMTGTATAPAHNALRTDSGAIALGVDTGNGPGVIHISRRATTAPGAAIGSNTWQLAEIDAGLPEVTSATSGMFVPQMLNLHWLDALEFDKGCYPGQEVIARLQYRGRLTRRMFRMRWRGVAQPQPGDEIHDDDNAKQGAVVRSARTGNEEGRLLAVIRVNAREKAMITGHTQLEVLDLPYSTDTQTAASAQDM